MQLSQRDLDIIKDAGTQYEIHRMRWLPNYAGRVFEPITDYHTGKPLTWWGRAEAEKAYRWFESYPNATGMRIVPANT